MLIQHGYAGLSMDGLAEATEYSKGLIYQHFSSKEDLVMALASQTMEQRTSLFERAVRFAGRARERIACMGVADQIFARLYPHAFRSELIIKLADLGDRASAQRSAGLSSQEGRCIGFVRDLVDEAVAVGDLPAAVSTNKVMIALLSMIIGSHTLASNFRPLLGELGVTDPIFHLRDNIQILLDGFGWKPLSTEWDYAVTDKRIAIEVFANELQSTGLR
jgi:AcrR family transcriptional regulator